MKKVFVFLILLFSMSVYCQDVTTDEASEKSDPKFTKYDYDKTKEFIIETPFTKDQMLSCVKTWINNYIKEDPKKKEKRIKNNVAWQTFGAVAGVRPWSTNSPDGKIMQLYTPDIIEYDKDSGKIFFYCFNIILKDFEKDLSYWTYTTKVRIDFKDNKYKMLFEEINVNLWGSAQFGRDNMIYPQSKVKKEIKDLLEESIKTTPPS